MSIRNLHLYNLLKLAGSPQNRLISAIRDDLRTERNKLMGIDSGGGGDFHLPFWTDAKQHAVGAVDLLQQSEVRVVAHKGRRRLYPLLTDGFLSWFDEFKRSTNQRLGWLPENIHNHYDVPGLGVTVKVDNLLALRMGEERHRLIYPYFSEEPMLSERWARVGLWLMREALPDYDATQMEILDVLRAISFSGASTFFRGDEETLLAARYREIESIWDDLRPEYGL